MVMEAPENRNLRIKKSDINFANKDVLYHNRNSVNQSNSWLRETRDGRPDTQDNSSQVMSPFKTTFSINKEDGFLFMSQQKRSAHKVKRNNDLIGLPSI